MTEFIFPLFDAQHDSPVMPVYDLMLEKGYDVCFGSWEDEADYYIGTRGGEWTYDHLKNPRFIYNFHGIGEAETCYMPNPPSPPYKTLLLSGEKWLRGYCEDYPEYVDRFKLIGWPKSDILFSSKKYKIKKIIEDSLNLPFDTTLFIAGWERLNDLVNINMFIDRLLKIIDEMKIDINVLIRSRATNIGNPAYNIKPQFDNEYNVRIIDPNIPDITPFFLVSDVLLSSGATSTINEFMLTNKPTIQIGATHPDYPSPAGIYLDMLVKVKVLNMRAFMHTLDKHILIDGSREALSQLQYANMGFVINDDHIKAILDEIFIKGIDRFKDKRLEWIADRVYKPDGHATERALKVIDEVTEK